MTQPHTFKTLTKKKLQTPLGPLLAIGNEKALYLLEFLDCKDIERRIDFFLKMSAACTISGCTQSIESIEDELNLYFKKKLTKFNKPLFLTGTPFQKRVWNTLLQIPYGVTCSYADLAYAIDQPKAFRAVARANSTNRLAIIIPCHRVINSNGHLGGYAGGSLKKQWLLDFERTDET